MEMIEPSVAYQKLSRLMSSDSDTVVKVREITRFALNFGDMSPALVLELADEINRLMKGRPDEEKGAAVADMIRSFTFSATGKHQEAQRMLKSCTVYFESHTDDQMVALCYLFQAFSMLATAQLDKAFELAFRALRMAEEGETDPYNMAWILHGIGVIYFDLKDYENSLLYFRKMGEALEGFDSEYACARMYSGVGSALLASGRTEEAAENIFRSVGLYEKSGHILGLSRALNDLGIVKRMLGNAQEAAEYLGKALELRRSHKYVPGIITSLIELGTMHMKAGSPDKATPLLHEAAELAAETRSKGKLFQAHRLLAEAYREAGDPVEALAHFEKYMEFKSEVTGEESRNKLAGLEKKFATERSEREAEIHRLKNVELRKAYDEIETKNREILDSITYARRLQQAIMPSQERFSELLPGAFVLYLPRDIVSGDFYWMETAGDKILFAAVDCTGHGVPGAFVSIVGANSLHRCVHEFGLTDPGDILSRLSRLVCETFSRSGEQVNDGMDIALCCYDKANGQLHYAGAYNNLYRVRNGETTEYKADKHPVGNQFEQLEYRSQLVELEKGDAVYIFTDGYADQFGGPKGKKFKKKRLQEKLAAISKSAPAEQKEELRQSFNDWKDKLEQVDDVLVIGVRF
ncbi:MAG: Serine/threonine protein kinase [Bacteroidetes bacterium]|nr:MAG: Serine/threonine protein kinase [Bacteroidota bacterium]